MTDLDCSDHSNIIEELSDLWGKDVGIKNLAKLLQDIDDGRILQDNDRPY